MQTQKLRPVPSVVADIAGRRPNPATVWRWIKKGRRGHRLRATLVCGIWHCTPEDFLAFCDSATQERLQAAGSDTAGDDYALVAAGIL